MNKVPQTYSRHEKSSSTQHNPQTEQTNAVIKNADAYLPKTRFNSQDTSRDSRSCSSPRLKSFPIEEIKKLDTLPPFSPDPIGAIVQQIPQEEGTLYVAGGPDQRQNSGQGDAVSTVQQFQQQHQHQNMHTVSQQQVAPHRAMHQISEMGPNSECTLPQQVVNGQAHRPFVPHGSHECSPWKNAQADYTVHSPTLSSPPAAPMEHQQSLQQSSDNASPMSNQEKNKPEDNNTKCSSYDKQPVGGRSSKMYRQMMMGSPTRQLQSEASTVPNLSNPSNPSNDNYQQQPSATSHHAPHSHTVTFPSVQNPQHVYQQMQQTTAQQQQMQRRAMQYQMQMMANQQQMQRTPEFYNVGNQQPATQAPGLHSIPSPQNATMNQMKTSTDQVQQNYLAHRNPRNESTRNNQVVNYSSIKSQLKPYNLNVVNNSQPFFAAQNQQQQQLTSQYQRQQLTPQYQQQQFIPQYQQQAVHQRQKVHVNQVQDNTVNQQTHTSHQLAGQQKPQTPAIKLPFTAGMIRDQEKLVVTMKQQRIPVDVMRRQFDTLLSEQRKQLEYIQEIKKQDMTKEDKTPMVTVRRRKPIDGKPEWMAHLTPSHVSYTELEKMHEVEKEKERQTRQFNEAQQTRQQVNETSNHQMPSHPQSQQQNRFYQQPNWQQQNGIPQPYNNMYSQPSTLPGNANTIDSIKPSPNAPPMNYQYYQEQKNVHNYQYAQYPHQQQQNPQFQQYQQVYQSNQQQNQHQVQSTNNSSAYKETKPTSDSSSLLKLRLYKEQIRPQKRNNGLQDLQALRKEMENVQATPDIKKGLEYLTTLTSKKPPVRLNGIQDRSEIQEELRDRLIMSTNEPPMKRVSSNGLENNRNPNNPSTQRFSNPNNPSTQRFSNPNNMETEIMREYPRQKMFNPRNCYSVQAERENGTVAVDQQASFVQQQQLSGLNTAKVIPYNEKNQMATRSNVMPFKFESGHPQHYQQMQQYYHNTKNLARNNGEGDVASAQRTDVQSKESFDRAAGDTYINFNGQMDGQMAEAKIPFQGMHYNQPNIHEARTIGGVRYLARKQDYIPNTQLVAPETLIANRHLQPPMIY
ncbi:uncharacterized protein LOC143149111 [Ptiloglossa arizonensis]|uniref:uncharacterized protein LOC143149111 n=1 Tax=Ptiloglossa arizonensis TaxID=3350558 RepID=UPI003FA06BBE